MKNINNLSHFDDKSQSFWPSQVGRYANNKILMFRNYKKFSSELFIKDILACDCIYDTSWDSSLLEAKWDEFKNVFITVSDIHAPLHCRKLKKQM